MKCLDCGSENIDVLDDEYKRFEGYVRRPGVFTLRTFSALRLRDCWIAFCFELSEREFEVGRTAEAAVAALRDRLSTPERDRPSMLLRDRLMQMSSEQVEVS